MAKEKNANELLKVHDDSQEHAAESLLQVALVKAKRKG